MKILLFANTDWYLYNFRLGLARALRQAGHQVGLVSPPGQFARRLVEAGFDWLPVTLSPKGLYPLQELRTLQQLAGLYRREKPDLVHHFTVKCVLYGSAAARLARIPAVVNSITGLGYVYINSHPIAFALRWLVTLLYRVLLRGTRVIFQNPDDRQFFIDRRMVQAADAHIIKGSGVDTDQFFALPEPPALPVALLPSRLLWDKGVGEFVAAARALKQAGISARFALAGAADSDNPAAISASQIGEWEDEGVVEYWGFSDDIRSVLARCHLVCLPSYREGLPRILIEAASSARALIATDVPGCREVVQDDINGLLVPPRDSAALAAALRTLLTDHARRQAMATRSREIAVSGFSVGKINRETMQVYDEVRGRPPSTGGGVRG